MARQVAASVSADVWRMGMAAAASVALAVLGCLFLRLVLACFWLPGRLKKEETVSKERRNQVPEEGATSGGEDEEDDGGNTVDLLGDDDSDDGEDYSCSSEEMEDKKTI